MLILSKILRYSIIFLFWIFSNSSLYAQVVERFDDGDFELNPVWSGDSNHFIINAQGALQQNTSTAGISYLATRNLYGLETEWQCWIRLSFIPSGSSNSRIYLVSDRKDLSNALYGYYLQVGATANGGKLQFYRQDGNNSYLLWEGNPNRANKNPALLRIKTTRDSLGVWSFYADTAGGTIFIPEGEVNDDTYKTTSWFGWCNRYAQSYSKSFIMDDVFIQPYIRDKTPPKMEAIQIKNDSQLIASFNEPLDTPTSTNKTQYFISDGIGYPIQVNLLSANKILISINGKITPNKRYTLFFSNIKDLIGNALVYDSFFFQKNITSTYGLIINELYPDPSSSNGLPNSEYIELFNFSGKDINLNGFKLNDVSSQCTLPNYLLKNDSFVVIVPKTAIGLFTRYKNILGVDNFPTLNNNGEEISLSDSQNVLLDKVIYSLQSYKDAQKQSGGWSLERINPYDSCLGMDNFRASINPLGGTPNLVNSVYQSFQDNSPPMVLGFETLNPTTIKINFNERLIYSFTLSDFSMNGNTILSADINPNNKKQLDIILLNPLQEDIVYYLTLKNISDCTGNLIQTPITEKIIYFIPKKSEYGSVVVSEIMSNPKINNPTLPFAKYIELHNRSSQTINLKNWYFRDAFTTSKPFNSFILSPDSFVLLVNENDVQLFNGYNNLIGVASFPNLNLDNDSLFLYNDSNQLIYSGYYDVAFHINPLKREGGWSLELSDKDKYCVSQGNFISSMDSKAGTPAQKNSVSSSDFKELNFIIENIYPLTNNQIIIEFNCPTDEQTVFDIQNYSITGNKTIFVQSVTKLSEYKNKYLLQLSSDIGSGEVFLLTLNGLKNCYGNNLFKNTYKFGLSNPLDLYELVFNEVLPQPNDNSAEYIELYNPTDNKIADLMFIQLVIYDEQGNFKKIYNLSNKRKQIFPKEYILLSPDPDAVKNSYPKAKELDNFYKPSEFPPLTDNGQRLVLMNSFNLRRIDSMNYASSWHSPFIKNYKGISLEKINPIFYSDVPNHWQSATQESGYGTPGYQNSQYKEIKEGDKEQIFFETEHISPDGDGFNDVLQMRYTTNKTGYTADYSIFDIQGILIKSYHENSIGTNGILLWDGTDNQGKLAPAGNYIVFVQIGVDTDANSITTKKAISVTYKR